MAEQRDREIANLWKLLRTLETEVRVLSVRVDNMSTHVTEHEVWRRDVNGSISELASSQNAMRRDVSRIDMGVSGLNRHLSDSQSRWIGWGIKVGIAAIGIIVGYFVGA